jgi:hypothetical protein
MSTSSVVVRRFASRLTSGLRWPLRHARVTKSLSAAALSGLLHAALLSALLSKPGLEIASPAPMPGFLMQFEVQQASHTQYQNPPSIVPLLEPVRSVVVPSPVAEIDTAVDQTASTDPTLSASLSLEDSKLLTTTADSDFEVPRRVDASPAEEPQTIEMRASQRELLERWVLQEIRNFQDTDEAQASRSFQHGDQRYTALLMRRPAGDDTGIERVIVDLATEEAGRPLRTRLQIKRLAFSHFTQLVNRWSSEILFHDDEIVGRFHSNNKILIAYDHNVSPRFRGKVTTAARGVSIVSAFGSRTQDEIFLGGIEPRAERIPFPEKWLPLAPAQADQNARVHSFPDDTRITFYADGRYGWSKRGSADAQQMESLASTPTYLMGARDATLYVRGIVKGQVLVYSPKRIVIEGDLIYAHDPRSSSDTDDYLGLVSDQNVEIASPRVTGPGDLEIHAAIYARNRFVVTHTEERSDSTLIIYGSLSAGTLTETEPRYGTKLEFDPRLEHRRPPGFPLTNRYEIESWDAKWQQ